MEKRKFGRTGHESTIAIFGAAAFFEISQSEADKAMELVVSTDINHIDVAPSYGQAEERLAPWMKNYRDRFYLGCKTMERSREAAEQELHRSLQRLGVETFDLYQLHAVNTIDELDLATQKDGALETLIAAREAGLVRHLGITAHGSLAPQVISEALRRFDFDSVLFPLNFVQMSIPAYNRAAVSLLKTCVKKEIGVMAIKSITKAPWIERPKGSSTWYEPFTTPDDIQRAVHFTLSQPVTAIITASDPHLLSAMISACETYLPMPAEQQAILLAEAENYTPLFP